RHPAGGVDHDRLERVTGGDIGKAHPPRTFLMHAPAAASLRAGRHCERDGADGPVAGKNLTLCRRARKQVSTPRQISKGPQRSAQVAVQISNDTAVISPWRA